ncbi:uncharacterized protein LOC100142050 [Tribolium castaneum]|uniref:Uncharacterized protein n=1 Tax=Tribolium castaneum TaxID=7070 RepID=D6WVF2_TRICA|nr:PREDICTED: uncharacterized protein LOC100142050 [Tribolium castaneum]EFA08308.2 hypothetical protein TcasGA2_TC005944 [Tribolium castaneum]|eukprot:XP_001810419.2 PREDICTED: uncharacterized protein LOC100142050 [Tribolium castaneum]
MRFVTVAIVIFVAAAATEAAPKPAGLSGYSRRQWSRLFGRSVDPIDGDLIGRSVDPIDGDLIGRSVDPIDGDLIGRSLDRIGGGNLVGRSVDPIDGDLIGRSVDPIDGDDLIGRSLDRIGGGNLVGRSVDPIDGDLIGRSLDGIGGGNLVGRGVDPIDGDLIGRSLDIKRLLDGYRRKHNAYEEVIGQKTIRNFGVLQLGGGYGVAKRFAQPGKYDTKTEKHRRGPLNGLIPGGAFGRAARSCLKTNCLRLLKGQMDAKIHPYFSFDSDRQATKPGIYKTYQLLEME